MTASTTEQERAEFERELIDNHHYVPSDFSFKDGFYGGDDDYIQFGWDLWQAARRAPAAPVPQGLREAAQAVVELWDTPLWKDVPATAVYIADLRAALAAAPQPPEEYGLKSEIRTTSTAPVQMPEPAGCVVYANGELHHWDANRECAELFASSERSRGAPYAFTFENLYTEQQVRQLLADNGIGKDKA